jgi:DNA-binding transcriptional regulator YiaG
MAILGSTLKAELKEAIGLSSLETQIQALRRELGELRTWLAKGPAVPRRGASAQGEEAPVTGEQVRNLRGALGDTRKTFAARLKVSPSIVFMWESGRSQPRRTAVVGRLRQLIASAPSASKGPRVGEARAAAPIARRTVRISAARRAALKLQGQYMGALRSLQPRQKVQVKKVREAKGLGPAIKLAKRLSA